MKDNLAHFLEKLKQYTLAFPWIPAVLAAGAALRVAGLTAGALWYDEVFSLTLSRLGLWDMIRALTTNISPPAWEMVMWFVTRLLGRNELASRIVPLFASLAALWVALRLTQVFQFKPAQQVGAMTLVALLPYQLWMSQDGRVYAVYALLYALGILWALQGRWLGLAAVLGLMLWCHNTAVLYIPAIGLVALAKHPRAWRSILITFMFALVAWLPWTGVVFRQARGDLYGFPQLTVQTFLDALMQGLFAWSFFILPPNWVLIALVVLTITIVLVSLEPLWNWLAQGGLFRLSLDWTLLPCLWPGLLAHFVPEQNHQKPADTKRLLDWLVIVPLALIILTSWLVQNVLYYRVLSPLVIPLALWFGLALNPHWLKGTNWPLAAMWASLLVAALTVWSPTAKGSSLSEVISLIRAEWQPGDVLYHANGATVLPFWHYLPSQAHYLLDGEKVMFRADVEIAQIGVHQAALAEIPHRRAWIVWSHNVNPKAVDARMDEYVENCPLVGQIRYWHVYMTEVYLCAESRRQ